MTFVLDFATFLPRLHDGDIDVLRLSKKNYTLYVVVCTYMLLFLVASSSLSLTTHRHMQRGLYNQGKNRTVGSAYNVHIFFRILVMIMSLFFLSFFVLNCFFLHIYCRASMVFELSQDNCFFLC